MYKIFTHFGFQPTTNNDVELSVEELGVVEDDFLPWVEDELKELGLVTAHEPSGFLETKRFLEARGKIANIDPTPTFNKISKTIEDRNYVSMFYHDVDGGSGHRLIEPYAFGKGYRWKGKVIHKNRYYLRAFVIMDSSKDETTKGRFIKRRSVSVSDKATRWRLFRVDNIETFTNLKKKFGKYRAQYNPSDKQMGTIITSLQHNEFPKGQNPKINF